MPNILGVTNHHFVVRYSLSCQTIITFLVVYKLLFCLMFGRESFFIGLDHWFTALVKVVQYLLSVIVEQW